MTADFPYKEKSVVYCRYCKYISKDVIDNISPQIIYILHAIKSLCRNKMSSIGKGEINVVFKNSADLHADLSNILKPALRFLLHA